jgi:TPR repeat protein
MPKVSQAQIKERIAVLIKEAEEGDTDSMRYLADMYSDGEYLPKDYFAAEAWLRKAAEQDDDKAKFKLAKMLSEGNGIARNLEEAFNIYYELMFDGYADAMIKVGTALKEGIGVPKDEEQGEKYLRFGKIIDEDLTDNEKRQEEMYKDLKNKKK